MPRKRMASLRIVENSCDPRFRTSAFVAWLIVSTSRGFVQRAGATTGQITRPVAGFRMGQRRWQVDAYD